MDDIAEIFYIQTPHFFISGGILIQVEGNLTLYETKHGVFRLKIRNTIILIT